MTFPSLLLCQAIARGAGMQQSSLLHPCKTAEAGGPRVWKGHNSTRRAHGRTDGPELSMTHPRKSENHRSHIMLCLAIESPFSIFSLIFLASYFRCGGSILVFPRQYFNYRASVTLRVWVEVLFITLWLNSKTSDIDSLSKSPKCAVYHLQKTLVPNTTHGRTHTHPAHLCCMTNSIAFVSQKDTHQLSYFISFTVIFLFFHIIHFCHYWQRIHLRDSIVSICLETALILYFATLSTILKVE